MRIVYSILGVAVWVAVAPAVVLTLRPDWHVGKAVSVASMAGAALFLVAVIGYAIKHDDD